MESTEQLVSEGFGTSTVMNVKELRMLYYGRVNLYVTFTDDGKLDMKNKDPFDRPYGYVAYTVADVVGRKVKTSEFYANVYRVKKTRASRKFIENIRTYDSSDLKDDIMVLRTLRYFEPESIDAIVENVSVISLLKSPFDRFWEITKQAALLKGNYWRGYWRRILLDLGYSGVADPSGTGTLIKKKTPVALIFDRKVEELDIVPIQKRRDPRRRVVRQIDHYVKKLATSRNRVAKRKFKNRATDTKDGDDLFFKAINNVNAITGMF